MAISARRLQRVQQRLAYQGTSIGPLGYRIAEMFGGDGNGSWINTPMQANTAVHPLSSQAVADIVLNIRTHKTGLPSQVAWPSFSYNNWSASLNVVDSASMPLVPILARGGNVTQSWAFATQAMMYAGFPIPDGLEPTDDGDGTIYLYDPDWKWAGRPNDPQYHGRIWELWGARSPAQNAADGLPAVWTALHGGRMTGVNNRLHAHMILRNSGSDVTTQAIPTAYAPKAPNDTSSNAGYWGYGPDGVYESSTWLASASHLAMSHHILRISDMVNGVIKHPMGFSLYPMVPGSEGSKPHVWPATGYDSASREWLRHGNRLRLPAGYTATPPPSIPASWHALWHMFVNCFRDYGIIMVDTTGSSFGMRGEPGLGPYLPSGWDSKMFLQSLPWEDMQMLAVGNDNDFYPPT